MDETQQVQNQNPITPIPPIVAPIVQPVSAKLPQLSIIILSLLSIIFLSGMAYFYFQIQSLKQQLIDKPTTNLSSTSSPSAAPVNDPMVTWQTYSIKELGVSFRYPPTLQLMDYPSGIEAKGEKGTQLCLSFIPFTTSLQLVKPVRAGGGACQGIFAIGSTSTNYEAGREGGFGDIQSYIKTGNTYKANFVLGKQYDLPSELVRETTNQHGIKILVIEGKNTTQYDVERGPEPMPGTPGEGYLGAIVNVEKNGYSGFNIQMKLSPKLTSETFDQILSTLQLTQ